VNEYMQKLNIWWDMGRYKHGRHNKTSDVDFHYPLFTKEHIINHLNAIKMKIININYKEKTYGPLPKIIINKLLSPIFPRFFKSRIEVRAMK